MEELLRNRLLAGLCLAALLCPAPGIAQGDDLARARQHVDQGQPDEALALLDAMLKKGKPDPEALLLRSTARAMVGDLEGAYRDLKKALKTDPSLRQGWLNLAGLEIAEARYAEAYEALVEAQKLDPRAPDNHLNLGAVLVMQGKIQQADEHFASYLEKAGDDAEAFYLVASNYAMAGQQQAALELLRKAIGLNERNRLRARADNRFLTLDEGSFQELLNQDSYTPPEGSHTRSAAFPAPYSLQNKRLLYAALQAFDELGLRYDPAVETTARWALVWTEKIRVKLHNQRGGTGVLSLSAPAQSFTNDDWTRQTQEILQAVHRILQE